MGKTKDDFKKVGDIKGTFHTKAGMIKDRNNKDLNRSRRRCISRIIFLLL